MVWFALLQFACLPQRSPRSILCVRPGSHAVTGSILLLILKPDWKLSIEFSYHNPIGRITNPTALRVPATMRWDRFIYPSMRKCSYTSPMNTCISSRFFSSLSAAGYGIPDSAQGLSATHPVRRWNTQIETTQGIIPGNCLLDGRSLRANRASDAQTWRSHLHACQIQNCTTLQVDLWKFLHITVQSVVIVHL